MEEVKVTIKEVERPGGLPHYVVSDNRSNMNIECFVFKHDAPKNDTYCKGRAWDEALAYAKNLKEGVKKETLIMEL